jgi:hypothetical protein
MLPVVRTTNSWKVTTILKRTPVLISGRGDAAALKYILSVIPPRERTQWQTHTQQRRIAPFESFDTDEGTRQHNHCTEYVSRKMLV